MYISCEFNDIIDKLLKKYYFLKPIGIMINSFDKIIKRVDYNNRIVRETYIDRIERNELLIATNENFQNRITNKQYESINNRLIFFDVIGLYKNIDKFDNKVASLDRRTRIKSTHEMMI